MALRRHHVCSDRSWADHIHGDPSGTELLRPPETHGAQSAFGPGIEIAVHRAVARHDGADVDDAPAGRSEMGQGGLHKEQGPTDVGLEEPVEVGGGDAGEVFVEDAGARVVDDYVDGVGVEGFKSSGDEIGTEGGRLLVSGDSDSLDAEAFDAFDGFGGGGSVFAVVDYNLGFVSYNLEGS